MIERAADIAASYSTLVTLRQLFYRLVAEMLLENRQSMYVQLSRLTAQARRDGSFPQLLDQGRTIWTPPSWENAADIVKGAACQFRLDRAADQDYTIVLGVEKATMSEQLGTGSATTASRLSPCAAIPANRSSNR